MLLSTPCSSSPPSAAGESGAIGGSSLRPPIVSVVIPTFDRGPLQPAADPPRGELPGTPAKRPEQLSLLAQSLAAIFKQDIEPSDYEVIVVDDGSTDGTRDYLSRITPPCKFTWITQRNQGAAVARNAGAAIARGRILVFLDDDIVASPGLLRAYLKMHEQFPRSALTGIVEVVSWNVQHLTAEVFETLSDRAKDPSSPAGALSPFDLLTGNCSLEAEHFLAVGGFDASLRVSEDFELALRLQDRGVTLRYCSEALATEHYERRSELYLGWAYQRGLAHGLIARKHPRAAILLGLGRFFEGSLAKKLARRLVWFAAPVLARSFQKGYTTARRGATEEKAGRIKLTWYRILGAINYWSGLRRTLGDLRTLRALAQPRLLILGYHMVEDCVPPVFLSYGVHTNGFRSQLAYLSQHGYNTVTLTEWATARTGQTNLPPKPVAITFDDGYKDTWEKAWPCLAEHRFSATVFPVANAVGKTNQWDEAVGFPSRTLLASEDLRTLVSAGAEIGSHGATHAKLGEASPARLAYELEHSKSTLEDLIGRPVLSFAYPHGNFNAHVATAAKEAGYQLACCSRPGVNRLDTDPFALRRIFISGRDGHIRFASKILLAGSQGLLVDAWLSFRGFARVSLDRFGLRPAYRSVHSACYQAADRAVSVMHAALGRRRFSRKYFEGRFAGPDPWGYERRDYEKQKYREVLEAIRPAEAGRILELGCAEGLFTRQLAAVCQNVVGVDISARALSRARERCADLQNVEFLRLDLFSDSLSDQFDLVICGEILCFAESREALAGACAQIHSWVRPAGYVLLVHLRIKKEHPAGWPGSDLKFGADSIHAQFRSSREWRLISDRVEERYIITLLQKNGA